MSSTCVIFMNDPIHIYAQHMDGYSHEQLTKPLDSKSVKSPSSTIVSALQYVWQHTQVFEC